MDLTLTQMRELRAETVITRTLHRPTVYDVGATCMGCETPTEWPCPPYRAATETREWLGQQLPVD